MDDKEILITAEKRFDAVMNALFEGVAVIDCDLKILWANPVAESWIGKAEEIKGLYCYKVYRNRNKRCRDCPAVKVFRTGKVVKSIEPLAKGGDKYFAIKAAPIRSDDGNIIAAALAVQDCTKDHGLADKVKEISSRLRAIIDGIGDGISIIDRDFNITRVNRAVLDLFRKKDFNDVLGRKCYQEYYRREMPCVECPAEKTFIEGKTNRSTSVWRDGKEKRFLDVSTFPIKNGDGVSTVIECFRDITGMVNLEDQLLHSERLAGVGELAAGIAHELRNPLSIISSSIHLCLKKYDVSEDVKRHLGIILKNSESANGIISDLLDFAKPSGMSLKPGNVNEVIKKVCNLVQSRCSKQSVKLRVKMPRLMPLMILDEKRLESSFMNFILNSLDAMPLKGNLTVMTRHDPARGEIVVSFFDTGPGIPPENLDRIFNPFFTTKSKGTGLGLSIAHNVITCHKGRIDVSSNAGIGTEITVRFPVFKNKTGD